MLEQITKLFFRNELTSVVSILFIICSIILIAMLFSKAKYKSLNFVTRKTQSALTERWLFKWVFITMVSSIIALFILKLPFFQLSSKNLGLDNWIGTWSVNLEEFDNLIYDTHGKYELEFKLADNGELKGELFNQKGRKRATLKYISSEDCSYGFLKGKMGNEDGRKQEFEFMMFPNKKSFIGKYRKRNVSDRWKTWISHLKR